MGYLGAWTEAHGYLGPKSCAGFEKAGNTMQHATACIRTALGSLVVTVFAVCVLTGPTSGQARAKTNQRKVPDPFSSPRAGDPVIAGAIMAHTYTINNDD